MRVEATLFTHPGLALEPDSIRQLKDACRVPSVRHVLATPDIHVGFGVPIGCVVATDEVVIPAAVGYDINCGMRLMTTGLRRRRGRRSGPGPRHPAGHPPRGRQAEHLHGADRVPPSACARCPGAGRGEAQGSPPPGTIWTKAGLAPNAARIEEGGSMEGRPDALSERAVERGQSQLGTLGGGNHFIELQEVVEVVDRDAAEAWGLASGQLVVMIHSGSRGFGHQVGEEYMALARSRRYSEPHPNRELCFMPAGFQGGRGPTWAPCTPGPTSPSPTGSSWRRWCGRTSWQLCPGADLRLVYDVPHNMAKLERHGGRDLWVHRKGATRAFGPARMAGTPFEATGQPVLIPGSMGTHSYLLAGVRGGERALCSTNHGAGRCMSRTAAAGRSKHRGGRVTPRAHLRRGVRQGHGGHRAHLRGPADHQGGGAASLQGHRRSSSRPWSAQGSPGSWPR